MAYFLGIDVGAVRTVAAVARPGSGAVETVDLGDRPDDDRLDDSRLDGDASDGDGSDGAGPDGGPAGIVSVLHLAADGVLTVGARAQRRMLTEPDRVAGGFPGRIGNDAMLLAGEPWAPEELTAWLVRWVVDRVAEREGAPATAVAVSHPASWDADRVRLLADAVAEQDLEVAFLAPARDGTGAEHGEHPAEDERDTGARAARAAARALRAAATVTAAPRTPAPRTSPPLLSAALAPGALAAGPVSVDGSGSGRHAAIGRSPSGTGTGGTGTTPEAVEGSGRHVAVEAASAAAAVTGDRPGAGPPAPRAAGDDARSAPDPVEEAGRPEGAAGPADRPPAAHRADDAESAGDRPAMAEPGTLGGDHDPDDADDPDGDEGDERGDDPAGDTAAAEDVGTDDPAGGAEPDQGWDVPAPRSPHPADPATTNLVADLVGFTGGMGATNTAGLLSGYTPPHGMPALWSALHGGAAGAGTATATDSAVALPAQRAESGRWAAVAPGGDPGPAQDEAPVAAVPTRQNPTVLVSAGGLAAAVAVVATLFLWPAPRTTNSAARPVAAVPAATTAAEPSAPTVALTPTAEPTPIHRSRPPAPRPRRPVVPVVSVPESATESTVPPTDSTEPTESRTTAPPSTSSSSSATTTTTSSSKARNN